jgi:imidazolonepropionase-like amidohydrolase
VGIAPAGSVSRDSQIPTIDAAGKFVVPGYLDMHAHVFEAPKETSDMLGLMLANGITGWRQMTGTPELLEARKKGQLPLSDTTPELLIMSGDILTPFNAGTPGLAAATVQAEKAEGADFIKIGLTSPSAFMAALDAAKQAGLPFAGHLQNGVDPGKASDAGMEAIEHLGPQATLLAACSTDEAALQAEYLASPPLERFPATALHFVPFKDKLMALFESKVITRPTVLEGPAELGKFQRIVDTYSEDKCRHLAARFVANGTWQVPTLIRAKTSEQADLPEFLNDSNLRYMPPAKVKQWQQSAQDFVKQFSPAERQTFLAFYALRLRVLKLFEAVGVKMLAGDDTGGAIWVVPGFAMHQEFDELEKAGLSPLHVLQMTTLNAAEFLGRTSTMGSIETGKTADLVLLDANPIDSVQNLHKIHGVVRAGHYFARRDLDSIRGGIEAVQAAAH